jgi:predicted NAD/FAD-binding protein
VQGVRVKIAVIGAGISGIAAADALASEANVTLFEADRRLGGHTDSHAALLCDQVYSVDTGFVAFNNAQYPLFSAWLEHLGVSSQPASMSLSVSCPPEEFEYGISDLRSFFPTVPALFSYSQYQLLADIRRFNKTIGQAVQTNPNEPLGEYLHRNCFGQRFINCHIAPLCMALWSKAAFDVLQVPLGYAATFISQHGLLRLNDQPQWRVIRSGATQYLEAFERQFRGIIKLQTPVRQIQRVDGHARVITDDADTAFDAVIVACHGDQALALLQRPTTLEEQLLGAMRYQSSRVVLHSDKSYMPTRRSLWSSWNAQMQDLDGPATLSFWMNRIQSMRGQDFFLTLNPRTTPRQIWADRSYEHPIFDNAAIEAQSRLQDLDGLGGVFFCGSYWGWGLHEDGFSSGVGAADRARALLRGRPSQLSEQDRGEPGMSEIDAIIAAAKNQT